jgi:hypothetical protein
MYYGSVMCNDEALNVVIFAINANTHVFVHVDLHEIYLLDVKSPAEKRMPGLG